MAAARGYFHLAAHQRPNVGDTKTSVLGIDHMGWLYCDGRLLNVSEWKFLFDVIGYSFGSNTSNQFRLPDPAGRVLGYTGSGAGLTPRTMGSNFGAETHTLTIDEMPTHTHTHNATGPGGTGYGLAFQDGNNTTNAATNGGSEPNLYQPVQALTINTAGGSNAHNNMQPTLFLGNLFIYSGKVGYGNNPFTAGLYAGGTGLASNIV